MRNVAGSMAAVVLMIFTTTSAPGAPQRSALKAADLVPEFTHSLSKDWLNSPPLSLSQLRGKVVLVEFWTFECINCKRSIPWVHSVQQRFAEDGLVIVGVHTPELPQERRRANVVEALKRLDITHPVMLDDDYSYWNALGNRYWPAFYLIGRDGRLSDVVIGELHTGEPRARAVEQKLAELLAQPAK